MSKPKLITKPTITKSNSQLNQTVCIKAIDHAVKNNGSPDRHGPATILSAYKEQQLVGYCKNMQKLGFGLTRSGVNYCIMNIVKSNNCNQLFKNNGPGKAWWKRFIRDHPDLSFHVPQALLEAYAQRANPIIIRDHFDKLHKIIEQHSLTADQIWNMNETSFVISPKIQKVIATKAAGGYIPPLIIYKSIRTIPNLLDGAPAGTIIGFTETGYMKEDLFQIYIEHFISSIPPRRLPSELPFSKLKAKYSKACNKLHSESGELVTKHTFAKMFGPAYIKTYTPDIIINAYKAMGIWPFNPNAINPDQLLSNAVSSSSQQNSSILSKAVHYSSILSQAVHYSSVSSQAIHYSSISSSQQSHSFTQTSTTIKNELLKTEIAFLKNENKILKEKLETFKNPGICSLKLALKYSIFRVSQATESDPLQAKKRKTLPFARLLTNEESIRALKEIDELAKNKVESTKQRKEAAAQKQANREVKKAQKKAEIERKKEE
ncbi:15405_t:CDS:2, partial [Cetraspora pellucida]